MTDDKSDCFLRDELFKLSYVASGVLTLDHVRKQYVLPEFPKGVCISSVVVVEDKPYSLKFRAFRAAPPDGLTEGTMPNTRSSFSCF
jgi:hypothetical protein